MADAKYPASGLTNPMTNALLLIDIELENPIGKLRNYNQPVNKIHEKLDSYELTQFPQEKQENLQRQDQFGKFFFEYIESDKFYNNSRATKRISIMAVQFIIEEGLLYHLDIMAGAKDSFWVQLVSQTLRHDVMLDVHQHLHLTLYKMCMK